MKHVLFTVPEVVEVSNGGGVGPAGWQHWWAAGGLALQRPAYRTHLLLAAATMPLRVALQQQMPPVGAASGSPPLHIHPRITCRRARR